MIFTTVAETLKHARSRSMLATSTTLRVACSVSLTLSIPHSRMETWMRRGGASSGTSAVTQQEQGILR